MTVHAKTVTNKSMCTDHDLPLHWLPSSAWELTRVHEHMCRQAGLGNETKA